MRSIRSKVEALERKAKVSPDSCEEGISLQEAVLRVHNGTAGDLPLRMRSRGPRGLGSGLS